MFNLSSSVVSADQPIIYYLSEGAPKRGFVRVELQVVPVPPENVLKYFSV